MQAASLPRVIIDTGPLVAWFDASDAHHGLARHFLDGYSGELLTTWPVLAEVCHLLPEHMVAGFMRWLGRGAVSVVDVPVSALSGLADRIDKYADLPMDLADCSLLWLAESIGLLDIATLDRRDFGVYRTARGQALRNVLFDPPQRPRARKRTVKR